MHCFTQFYPFKPLFGSLYILQLKSSWRLQHFILFWFLKDESLYHEVKTFSRNFQGLVLHHLFLGRSTSKQLLLCSFNTFFLWNTYHWSTFVTMFKPLELSVLCMNIKNFGDNSAFPIVCYNPLLPSVRGLLPFVYCFAWLPISLTNYFHLTDLEHWLFHPFLPAVMCNGLAMSAWFWYFPNWTVLKIVYWNDSTKFPREWCSKTKTE